MTMERLSLEYGDSELSLQIIRRDRKTLEINVQPDMSVVVVAPFSVSEKQILRKVRQRAAWITKQIRFFNQFHPRLTERKYVSGETHRYLGRQYRLKVLNHDHDEGIKSVRMMGGYIEIRSKEPDRSEMTKKLADAWFKERAHLKFAERLEFCLSRFPRSDEYRPVAVTVRQMKKRWGSMSQSRRLILNRDLIHAPVDAIDYVITHELCHVEHDHHGPAFIKLLERIMPDWEFRKMKLEKVLA